MIQGLLKWIFIISIFIAICCVFGMLLSMTIIILFSVASNLILPIQFYFVAMLFAFISGITALIGYITTRGERK